jgi:hypothetical protein
MRGHAGTFGADSTVKPLLAAASVRGGDARDAVRIHVGLATIPRISGPDHASAGPPATYLVHFKEIHMSLIHRSALVLMPLLLAACMGDDKPVQTAATTTPADEPTPATAPVAMTPAAVPARPVAAAADLAIPRGGQMPRLTSLGVPICDAYFEAVRTCMNEGHGNPAEQKALRGTAINQYNRIRLHGGDLELQCGEARAATSAQMAAIGCQTPT